MKNLAIVLIAAAMLAAPAQAGIRFPLIADPDVKAACSECHMAYFPELLPQASWRRMIGDLENHFGEDASLDAAELEKVLAYYTANAADVSANRAARRWGHYIRVGEAPLRVTKLAIFARAHEELGWFTRRPKTMSNCVACHGKNAERGYFDE